MVKFSIVDTGDASRFEIKSARIDFGSTQYYFNKKLASNECPLSFKHFEEQGCKMFSGVCAPLSRSSAQDSSGITRNTDSKEDTRAIPFSLIML